jgi:hypothetical protein
MDTGNGSILDINMENECELELLHDLRSGDEDLQYARELELAEDEEAPSASGPRHSIALNGFERDWLILRLTGG